MARPKRTAVHSLIVGICVASGVLHAQVQTTLYPFKHKVAKNTLTAISREVRLGKRLYQIYRRAGSSRTELFRVEIGDFADGDLVRTWNIGIGAEADLNGDEQPDYLWYGGDDTSESFLLFLSGEGKYSCVDVIKSAESAWRTRFHQAAPDLADLDGNFHISKISWNSSDGSLSITVLSDATKPAKKILLDVARADYKR